MNILYSDTNFYNAVKSGDLAKVKSMFDAARKNLIGTININWINTDD